MILVDTSVWIDHFRHGLQSLQDLLESDLVLVHGAIVGELACGNLHNRKEVLKLLGSLPMLPAATDEEVLVMIERNSLMGLGIGYLDTHLLAAARIGSARLWTLDKRLHEVAANLGISHRPESRKS